MPTAEDHEAIMAHSRRAIELLEECKAIHEAEKMSLIYPDIAIRRVTDLIDKATEESAKAIALMRLRP